MSADEQDPYAAIFASKIPCPSPMRSKQWDEVPAWVRRKLFFLSGVDDAVLLNTLREILWRCIDGCYSVSYFVNEATEALRVLENPKSGEPYYYPKKFESMSDREKYLYQRNLDNIDSFDRLRLIYLSEMEKAAGEKDYTRAFDPFWREMYPGWRFVRQPGAKEKYKRRTHIKHEEEVHLKTDLAFWLAMNDASIGGYGLPHKPFGYLSWMRVVPVSRKECENLGLLKKGEPAPDLTPAEKEMWGVPLTTSEQADADRLAIVAERDRIIREILSTGLYTKPENIAETHPKHISIQHFLTPANNAGYPTNSTHHTTMEPVTPKQKTQPLTHSVHPVNQPIQSSQSSANGQNDKMIELLERLVAGQEQFRAHMLEQMQYNEQQREKTYGPVRNLVRFVNFIIYIQLFIILAFIVYAFVSPLSKSASSSRSGKTPTYMLDDD